MELTDQPRLENPNSYKMNAGDRPVHSYADIFDRLDLTLGGGAYDKDVKKTAEISIEMCDLIQSELDPKQADAVTVAKRYWHGDGSEQERLRCLDTIIERRDKSGGNIATSERGAVLDRLVFSALQNNTGLSVLAGEYIVDLAKALGLPVIDVGKIFLRHIPGFNVNCE